MNGTADISFATKQLTLALMQRYQNNFPQGNIRFLFTLCRLISAFLDELVTKFPSQR